MTHRQRTAVGLSAAIVLVSAYVAAGQDAAPDAAAPGRSVTALAPFGDVDTPPPEWVKPGVRLVEMFRGMPGSDFEHGMSITDIIEVDGKQAIIREWSFDPKADARSPVPGPITQTMAVRASDGGGSWVHPRVLGDLPRHLDPRWVVLHGRQQIGAAVYEAVRVQGDTVGLVYDRRSGVRLLLGATAPPKEAVDFAAIDRSRFTTWQQAAAQHTTRLWLAGFRARSLPWARGKLPDWVAHTKAMTYEGRWTRFREHERLPPSAWQTARIEIQRVHERRADVRVTSTWRHPDGATSTRVREIIHHAAVPGDLAMDPAVLAQLKDGPVIDDDPQLKMTVRAHHERGPDGRPWVVITETSPTFEGRYAYDRETGTLMTYRWGSEAVGLIDELRFIRHEPKAP